MINQNANYLLLIWRNLGTRNAFGVLSDAKKRHNGTMSDINPESLLKA